ncbi:hypothetical protein [Sphingorhabdus sp. SMR4y]|uniref:hypothetical protein n=1 Tax=Sphingorhabdus sp. SMR4y TaxID=2584094 RepID=UPI001C9294E0|nr:hypothetical protein [Sphingorhabdus sp. SMR4y]
MTDYHGILIPQSELDFAIPHFEEDIPLYLDPFLLWASPAQQDQMLHTGLINAFNQLGHSYCNGQEAEAIENLIKASECDEVGLGSSARRKGKRIGKEKAVEVLELFKIIPRYRDQGFRHFEEIQFYTEGISKDRISDIACNFLKSFLIDFTIDQCAKLGIPTEMCTVADLYDYRKNGFEEAENIQLPNHPQTNQPLILVPKRWLRFTPWINYDDYFKSHCPLDDISHDVEDIGRIEVLNYNRENYGAIDSYITRKERTGNDCQNDPLFSQIPIVSAKRKLKLIAGLPTGKTDNADQDYENAICELLPSLLYPQLDFAQAQSRTDSGSQIRDLIFYNNRSNEFLKDIMDQFDSRQLVFEMKNVGAVSRDHINQLNRYMTDTLGKFGILVTRNRLSRARFQNTIDLWSGQRRCIVTLLDEDIAQMVELFASKQRLPLDVVTKKYVEFSRACPS